jgi:tetratricopeptide (TPR) repeat protein
MESKIEWYQEVLSLEPSSRIFFHLARLFVDNGQPEDAVDTLRQGLDRNPDYIEARLLLIELLSREEREDEAREQAAILAGILKRYPAFWRAWSQTLAGGEEDFGVALEFAAAYCSGAPLTWGQIIEHGLKSLLDRLHTSRAGEPLSVSGPGPGRAPAEQAAEQAEAALEPEEAQEPAPEPVSEAAEQEAKALLEAEARGQAEAAGLAAETHSLRTRTMAEVLAAQGDTDGALDILRELLDNAEPGPARESIQARIRELSAEAGQEETAKAGPGEAAAAPEEKVGPETPGSRSKTRLLRTLDRLAERLEHRAQA